MRFGQTLLEEIIYIRERIIRLHSRRKSSNPFIMNCMNSALALFVGASVNLGGYAQTLVPADKNYEL